MRSRTIPALALLLTVAFGVTACGQSEAEKQASCYDAIKARTEGDKAKPQACKDLSEDDYNTLVMGWVLEKTGLDELGEHPEDLPDFAEDGVVDRQQ